MKDTIEQIVNDIHVLLNDSSADINKNHHFAYEEYLDEYNSLIDRIHQLDILKEEEKIKELGAEHKGSGRVTSRTEIVKHLEINDKLKRLIRKTRRFIQPIEESKDFNDILSKLFSRFHSVARQLRNRYAGRPTIDVEDEYDVQDLFHALLMIEFEDIRPEEWVPSYAGSSSRIDFLLKQEKIVVEIKKTRKGLGAKEVGEQLIIDIKKYCYQLPPP